MMGKKDKNKLSVNQEKFCLKYAECGNGREAYKYAYPKVKSDSVADTNASRMLSNAKVKARLQELAKQIEDDSIADIKEMQKKLTQIIRSEQTEQILTFEGELVDKKPSIKDIISAIEKLGKMQGAFINKVQVSGMEQEQSKLDAILAQIGGNNE